MSLLHRINLPAPGRRQTLYIPYVLAEPCVLITVASPWFVPLFNVLPKKGLLILKLQKHLPSSFNIILSSAKYTLLIHLCRFRVRLNDGVTPGTFRSVFNPLNTQLTNCHYHQVTNINLISIDYGSPVLGRLTLRGLTLRRNP